MTPESCAGVLLEALPGVMWFVRRQMRSRRVKGLSVPQFRVLVQLRRRPAVSLSVIAELLGTSLPTTSRIVSGLVCKGFVVRQSCSQDRRQVSLHLTTRGESALEAAWSGTQAVLAERFAPLSAEDRNVLGRAFEILSDLFACKSSGVAEVCNGRLKSATDGSDALV